MNKKYNPNNIAIVIPTKNREYQLDRLFTSLIAQDERVGCIVVVDSGGGLDSVIKKFEKELNITYIFSEISGQIHQRNLGIKHVIDRFSLIGFVDDDLVFESEAIKNMIEFWNQGIEDVAGVGFNITNSPKFKKNKALQFFGLAGKLPGEVLQSGLNSSINKISSNIKAGWLGGGYTIWDAEILRKFPQDTLKTSWAIGEDLRYSYPIGKVHGLYVCSAAKVLHKHLFEVSKPSPFISMAREKKSYISQLYFVQNNPNDLSFCKCYWMLTWKVIFRLLDGIFRLNSSALYRSLGGIIGILLSLPYVMTKKSLETLLLD